MSDQGDFIIKTLRQWADDFSTDEDRDVFIAAADEIASLRAQLASTRKALEQVAIVCTDNMDRSCDHRMALDFVRQVANTALTDEKGK